MQNKLIQNNMVRHVHHSAGLCISCLWDDTNGSKSLLVTMMMMIIMMIIIVINAFQLSGDQHSKAL